MIRCVNEYRKRIHYRNRFAVRDRSLQLLPNRGRLHMTICRLQSFYVWRLKIDRNSRDARALYLGRRSERARIEIHRRAKDRRSLFNDGEGYFETP